MESITQTKRAGKEARALFRELVEAMTPGETFTTGSMAVAYASRGLRLPTSSCSTYAAELIQEGVLEHVQRGHYRYIGHPAAVAEAQQPLPMPMDLSTVSTQALLEELSTRGKAGAFHVEIETFTLKYTVHG